MVGRDQWGDDCRDRDDWLVGRLVGRIAVQFMIAARTTNISALKAAVTTMSPVTK